MEVHIGAKQVYFPGTEISSLVLHYYFETEGGKQLIKFTGTKANLSSLNSLVLVIASQQERDSSQIKADVSPTSLQAACGAVDEVVRWSHYVVATRH